MSSTAVRGKTTPVWPWRQPLVTDEAWALIAPLLPVAMATGRPRKWALRLLLEAVLYLLRTGCQWRQLPLDFPKWKTVYTVFRRWRIDGLWEQIHDALRRRPRPIEQRGFGAQVLVQLKVSVHENR